MEMPRYTIYDRHSGRWLSEIQLVPEHDSAIYTNWTRNPEEALRFPGTKTARQVLRVLNGKEFELRNGRGVPIC